MPLPSPRLRAGFDRCRVSATAAMVLVVLSPVWLPARCSFAKAEALTDTVMQQAEPDTVLALDEARARTARLAAALDELKRAAQPGHLQEPLSQSVSGLALESLREQGNALQLRAASLAATLGEHHPDLVAAQEAAADVRKQLQSAIKAAIVSTEHDLGDARAAEHRLTLPAADVTGSIAPRSAAVAPRSAAVPQPRLDATGTTRTLVASASATPAMEGRTSHSGSEDAPDTRGPDGGARPGSSADGHHGRNLGVARSSRGPLGLVRYPIAGPWEEGARHARSRGGRCLAG